MTMLGLSDLQFALAIIGLLILIAVAVLNIKYARARRKAKELSEYSLDDRFGKEPSFGQGFADGDAGRTEPSFGEALTTISAPEKFAIDPRIDCVITLRFDEAISGSEILEEINAWTDLRAQSTARWMCEGLNANLDVAEDWEELHPDSTYSDLQLAIQLASRKGAIGVLELSDFCSRAQALAETLPQEERAFERMLSEGVEIAQAAHGRLVDDNGINLSEAAVISIRQHLDVLYANLEKSGVPAGSSTASRLFS